MAQLAKSVAWALLAVLQVAAALYLALVVGGVSGWMADDGWAATATVEDWWREAALRFGKGVFWATITGIAIWGINRLFLRSGLSISRIWPRLLAWIGFGVIAAASAIGAIQFAVEKPSM